MFDLRPGEQGACCVGHQAAISVWLFVAVHAMSGQTMAMRPHAGQGPASPSCALSLQPIVKQREPLPDFSPAPSFPIGPRCSSTVHRGRWNIVIHSHARYSLSAVPLGFIQCHFIGECAPGQILKTIRSRGGHHESDYSRYIRKCPLGVGLSSDLNAYSEGALNG